MGCSRVSSCSSSISVCVCVFGEWVAVGFHPAAVQQPRQHQGPLRDNRPRDLGAGVCVCVCVCVCLRVRVCLRACVQALCPASPQAPHTRSHERAHTRTGRRGREVPSSERPPPHPHRPSAQRRHFLCLRPPPLIDGVGRPACAVRHTERAAAPLSAVLAVRQTDGS